MTYRRLLARRLTPHGPVWALLLHAPDPAGQIYNLGSKSGGPSEGGVTRGVRDVSVMSHVNGPRLHPEELMAQSSVHLRLHLSTQTFICLFKR